MLVGLVALVQIWRRGLRRGRQGGLRHPAAPADAGVAAHLRAGLPKAAAHQRRDHRLAAPPRFVALAKLRAGEANPAAYPGERFADEQQKAYPDLRTLRRSTARWRRPSSWSRRRCASCKWRVAAAEPPTGKPLKARRARGDRPDDGGRLHRRHHRPRGGQCHPLAHRRALGLALRPVPISARTRRACAVFSPSCSRASTPPRGRASPAGAALRATRAGALVKKAERGRSAESGESQ